MYFSFKDYLKSESFSGFITVDSLMKNSCSQVPNKKGIYFVIRNSIVSPVFLKESVGGHFKKKNPTVELMELENKWNYDSPIIYIGKAGGDSSNATLQSRLQQYIKFGQGIPIGHWGGRYIWQLEDNRQLIICWKIIENEDCRVVEKKLIEEFIIQFGKRPFANLIG